MTQAPTRARLGLRLLTTALVAGLGFVGLRNGLIEWTDVETLGQRIATITEIAYGLFGLFAAAGLLARHPRTVPMMLAWAAAIVVTAGMAPIVWGGGGLLSGLAAGSGTALIAWGVIWLGRRALVGAPSAPRPSP